ncbi:MAG: zinc ribbon domain-containing protein, partial [Planctomycetaceae bacterium]|nr:zinc ribbon domain-containing protein [Planctomycetaceae bacterium]
MTSSSLPGAEKFRRQLPADDNRERLTCMDCGWIHYENP